MIPRSVKSSFWLPCWTQRPVTELQRQKKEKKGWGLLRVPQTSSISTSCCLLCSDDPKCSEHLLFFKDHVPWEDTVHRPQVWMSSEPHVPCSEDIKDHEVYLLHCGCFLAVTTGHLGVPPTPPEDETAEPQSKPQWPAPSIFQTDMAISTSSWANQLLLWLFLPQRSKALPYVPSEMNS